MYWVNVCPNPGEAGFTLRGWSSLFRQGLYYSCYYRSLHLDFLFFLSEAKSVEITCCELEIF